MPKALSFKAFGENAVLISWKNEISEAISLDIHRYNRLIHKYFPEFIVETVPAYCSLTVFFQPQIDLQEMIKKLKNIQSFSEETKAKPRTWKIPVCYDLSLGIDLENLAKMKSLTVEEVIAMHTQSIYRVGFIGFLPGFPYLSGLNPRLHTPRLSKPRLQIAKGSVAIGGVQTGIYPQVSPAGWHIIGRTKIELFDSKKQPPCFLKSMDKIQFTAISLREFKSD